MNYVFKEINIKTCSYNELLDLYHTAKTSLTFSVNTPEYYGWLNIVNNIYDELKKRCSEIGTLIIN